MESKSLFERLGGSKGIERIVDEVASRHLVNPLINTRFKPTSTRRGSWSS